MYEIEKSFTFEAAHRLIHHDGKCRELHGHSYQLAVILQADTLQPSGPKTNMVMDFCEIGAVVKKLIHSHLDHKYLNETLESDSPTAEFIAKWLFERLKPSLPTLFAIRIGETATSAVTYRPK